MKLIRDLAYIFALIFLLLASAYNILGLYPTEAVLGGLISS
jgi:hypothetical protein